MSKRLNGEHIGSQFLSSRQSAATNAAGIDNAGSKWSREAQTKFVPRGLRQDSIINGSLFHDNNEEIFRFAQNDISTYLSSRQSVATRDLCTINIH